MTTLYLRKSIGRSPLRLSVLLIPLVLVCFGLLPIAQAADGDLGKGNTSEGGNALQSLTTGIHNTADGYQTLFSDTTGNYNTATGSQALKNNTDGFDNTADGFQALYHNTTGGVDNTATGWRALFSNTTGGQSTATGSQALFSNTAGFNNTADGFQALSFNTTGGDNTASGDFALSSNTTGSSNTADGFEALSNNTTGGSNIALGAGAGINLTTSSNNIDIGNFGVAADDSTIRIGEGQTSTFIAGINGAPGVGVTVLVTSNGQLVTGSASSARFKTEIKPMDKASEAILALKPVTFHYKKEIDPEGSPQFGLVAEEVEKVNPDLVTRDAKGDVYTVRYEAVNAMLLNEFLKEHRTVQELKSTAAKQEATNAQQQKEIKALTASLKEQASQIQKVSAQLEMNKPAPQIVVNDQ